MRRGDSMNKVCSNGYLRLIMHAVKKNARDPINNSCTRLIPARL